jgi:hypothetical protein
MWTKINFVLSQHMLLMNRGLDLCDIIFFRFFQKEQAFSRPASCLARQLHKKDPAFGLFEYNSAAKHRSKCAILGDKLARTHIRAMPMSKSTYVQLRSSECGVLPTFEKVRWRHARLRTISLQVSLFYSFIFKLQDKKSFVFSGKRLTRISEAVCEAVPVKLPATMSRGKEISCWRYHHWSSKQDSCSIPR